MPAAVRPYHLTHPNEPERLVAAVSPSAAIRHVSSGWKAEAVSAMEVGTLMTNGLRLETAGNGDDDGGDADPQPAAGTQQQLHEGAAQGASTAAAA